MASASSSSLKIYLDPCTINSRKVLAGLDLMGAKYDYHFINYFEGQQKSPEFVKINSMATVPAAVDGDLVLTESNAILQYAADITSGGDKYYPKDLKARANVNRWLLWESSSWFPAAYPYLVEYVVKPLMKSEPDEKAIGDNATRFNQLAAVLDGQLAKTQFVAGNLSIADVAVASCMHLHEAMKLPLEKYPNIRRWYADVEKLPAWQQTQGAVDKALLPGKKWVPATLNYTHDTRGLTELYFYEDEKAAHIHEPGDHAAEVQIHDGWDRKSEWSTDEHGFALRDFVSKYPKDQYDDDKLVREKFYPEVVSFLKETLGAKSVLVFDHTVRTQRNAQKKLTQESNTSQRAPVRLVHCDYTAESGPTRVRQLLPDEAEELLQRRVSFINVWKPLAKVEEMPLAMCDVTSSPRDDFFKLFLRYRDRTGENYVMKHNDSHKWIYFPEMDENQVILLKTYDSDPDRAQFVGHSAFEDPTSRKGAPFRESCEIRTICFF